MPLLVLGLVLASAVVHATWNLWTKQLGPAVRRVLAHKDGNETLSVDARNRRGKNITCRLTISPLVGDGKSRDGAIVLMEEWDGRDGSPLPPASRKLTSSPQDG